MRQILFLEFQCKDSNNIMHPKFQVKTRVMSTFEKKNVYRNKTLKNLFENDFSKRHVGERNFEVCSKYVN